MTHILTLKLTEPVTEPVVIEQNGQTLGVLISPADYQKVASLITTQARHEREAEQTRLIKQEIAAYEQMKPELLKTHKGQFVAILNGELVDSDDNQSALANRVYDKHGYRTMLIRKVVEHEPIYFMGGPQLVHK